MTSHRYMEAKHFGTPLPPSALGISRKSALDSARSNAFTLHKLTLQSCKSCASTGAKWFESKEFYQPSCSGLNALSLLVLSPRLVPPGTTPRRLLLAEARCPSTHGPHLTLKIHRTNFLPPLFRFSASRVVATVIEEAEYGNAVSHVPFLIQAYHKTSALHLDWG